MYAFKLEHFSAVPIPEQGDFTGIGLASWRNDTVDFLLFVQVVCFTA
jgi:hypothetical protein